jgi:hypothetical protein
VNLGTDGPRPDGNAFEPSALLAEIRGRQPGSVGFIEHDHAHVAHWAYPLALYLEPGKAFLVGSIEAPEDEQDLAQLRDLYYWIQRHEEPGRARRPLPLLTNW